MSKNRIIYNQISAYAGIVPSSGYHFIDRAGNLTNSIYSVVGGVTGYSTNAILPLSRITDISYGFSESRIDVKSLGNYGTIARPTISSQIINLNLSYNLMGLINESILGFYLSSGTLVNPLSGFLDKTFQWPANRNCKNIFIATNNELTDNNSIEPTIDILNETTGKFIKDNVYVYGFGDCYLDSYRVSAAVGDFPKANVSFTAYNINYVSGGSGHNIPSLNPINASQRTGITYCLPPVYTGQQATVLIPADINLNITETSGTSTLYNLPISFTDIKIQNFDINLQLNREPLNNLGYRLPLDRRINPPVYADLNISAIVGENEIGSFIDFVNTDTNYDISIDMAYSRNPGFSGTAINYKFLGSKFNKIDIADSINEKRLVNLSLTTELRPNNVTNGLFISGQLGIGSSSLYNTGQIGLWDFGFVYNGVNYYVDWGSVALTPTGGFDFGTV